MTNDSGSAGGMEPFAYFQWNPGWNLWEQVAYDYRHEEGVIPAYRLAAPAEVDAIAQAHAAGRVEGLEEAAAWHDSNEAMIAGAQANAELIGAIDLVIGGMEARRRKHREAATAIRARITTPTGGKA